MKTERDLKRSLRFLSRNRSGARRATEGSPERSRGATKEVPKRKRGAILFLAVGAIAVLSILAIGTASSVLQELRLSRIVNDANTSFDRANSVLEAMKIVFAHDPIPVFTFYKLRDRTIPFGDVEACVHFSDEQNKINIHLEPKEVILRLPGLVGQEQLAGKIVAANIAVKEEVLLVDGMTPEIYGQFKNLLTSITPMGVNINTASSDILAVLGLDEDLIRKIRELRAGRDGKEGTQDDQYVSSPADIILALEPLGLSEAQKTLLSNLIATLQLSANSDYINFSIDIKKGNHKMRSFKIILNISSGKIISWLEE